MTEQQLLRYARKSIAILVAHVSQYRGGNKWVTYSDLAQAIGFPEPYSGNLFGQRIGQVLGTMGHMWDGIKIDGESVPLIQTLVVSKGTRLPSDGLKEFNETYPNLSTSKKHDFVSNEYDRIYQFGTRWITLLSKLRIKISKSKIQNYSNNRYGHHSFGPEGSPEHRRFRDKIARDPTIIGLSGSYKAITEYPLRSGDTIDLVLEAEQEIVAVEVKSKRSGPDDLIRGLFQVVKYRAVLEAETKIAYDNRPISVILATEVDFDREGENIYKN